MTAKFKTINLADTRIADACEIARARSVEARRIASLRAAMQHDSHIAAFENAQAEAR